MSELVDCINGLTAKDIIKSVAKTANGVPFYLQTSGLVGLGDELVINGQFLIDTSNWGPVGCTITRVVNFNGEPTSGRQDATAASAQMRQINMSAPFVENAKNYRVTFIVYIPSTNTTTDSFRLRFLGTTSQYMDVLTPPPDTWTTFEVDFPSIGLSERIYMYQYDGVVVNATVGDDVYYAMISIKEIL